MKIIMLIGPDKCGKTATIKKVYNELSHYAQEIEPKTVIPSNPEGDFEGVLQLGNGQKIGFYSQGNHPAILIDAMRKYENEQKCDIWVCACTEGHAHPPGQAALFAKENFVHVIMKERHATEEYKNIIIDLVILLGNKHKLITVL
jgi:hypothetical protein